MAALRSALAMLSRGSSGSSAAAYVGGRGMGINQVLHRAAPPLHPPATRNVEGYRRFSTGMREPADKAESDLHMWWWQRARDFWRKASLEERDRIYFVYTVFVVGTPTVAAFKLLRDLQRLR